jgi:hypothetical protein
MTHKDERILELCRKVSTEKDGSKMIELVRELNQELDKVDPSLGRDEAKLPGPEHRPARSA